jgi:hypothetical protein
MSGGTAPNGLSRSGSWSGSAGWAGIVMTFSAVTLPSSPRTHSQMEPLRSWVLVTTPTKPYALRGLWAGRSSSTIWCSGPRSTSWMCRRFCQSQTCRECPYWLESSRSPCRPSSTIFGVPHVLVITVPWLMCHQKS